MSGFSGVWTPTQVSTDWAGDGYGGTGSIDDLTQVAGSIKVSQAFDDGMPDDVTFTSSSDPTSKAAMNLSGRSGLGAVEYWSPFNSSSPVYSYDRDVADLTVAPGAITSAGPETVTVFTGRMTDVPVNGRDVQLTAQSATRQALSTSVQPPPIYGDGYGLNATWPVSWALAQAGIYLSPPPRPGCRTWIPMHGSTRPFLPTTGIPYRGNFADVTTAGDLVTTDNVRPTFVDGPFVTGVYASAASATDAIHFRYNNVPMGDGDDLISKRASVGRCEFWVRADAANINAVPGGSASLAEPLATFFVQGAGNSPLAYAWGGIGYDRVPFVRVNDNSGHDTKLSAAGGAIPSDGSWRFIGFAWDIAGKKMWLNDNGTVTSTTLTSHVTTALEDINDFDLFQPPLVANPSTATLTCYLPIAEFQLTGGAQANPDNYVWINDATYDWTVGGDIRASQLDLVGLSELNSREAWELISSFAQAELAMMRTDEADLFAYYPVTWLAETAQQTVQAALSTSTNVDDSLALKKDPTTIRNQVTINYLLAVPSGTAYGSRATLHDDFVVRELPPGTSTFTMASDIAVLFVDITNDPFPLLSSSQVSAGVGLNRNYMCANTASDGTGTYATDTQVIARVSGFTASTITMQVTNLTAATLYTVNNGSVPFIHIEGAALVTGDTSYTVQSDASIAVRGTRGLTVDLPAIQSDDTAAWVASEILARLGRPRVSASGTVRGDPRRQPGDLVSIADPTATKASGQWRLFTVDHNLDGADYTQDFTAQTALSVGVWGTSLWGDCLWGP